MSDDHERELRTELAVNRMLQRWLLPPNLPDVAGLRFATLYEAGRDELTVGGDWYDAVDTDRGIALVVGDVVGHNARAAAEMGQVRHVLASHLYASGDVTHSLEVTDRYFAHRSANTMATLVAMSVDVDARTVTVASAGHPAPILARPDAAVIVLDIDPGPPIGSGFGGYRSATLPLPPGSLLVAYTDGLLEERDRPLDAGIELLRSQISEEVGGDATRPAAALARVAKLLGSWSADPGRLDDVAAIAVGVE